MYSAFPSAVSQTWSSGVLPRAALLLRSTMPAPAGSDMILGSVGFHGRFDAAAGKQSQGRRHGGSGQAARYFFLCFHSRPSFLHYLLRIFFFTVISAG